MDRFNGVGQRHSKMCLARMGFKIWSYIGNLSYQDSREHRITSKSNKKSGSTKCSMDAYLMGITSLSLSSLKSLDMFQSQKILEVNRSKQ